METTEPTPLQCADDPAAIHSIPGDLRSILAPATWCIYEWTNYQFVHEDADRLKVSSEFLPPIFPGSFQLHFANRLGLTSITPYRGTIRLANPLFVEVLARKFPDPHDSVDFLRALLNDLFAHVAALPFDPVNTTMRRVRESHQPPNDLFVFHFFRHHANQLIRGIQTILGRPHRVLSEEPAMVRPHEVRHIDPEAMLDLLRGAPASNAHGQTGVTSTGSPLARLRPERIRQRLPAETFDTPENRFILSACRRMYLSIERLQRQKWYQSHSIPEADRQQITFAQESLAMLIANDRFTGLEPSQRFPAQSRVLQQRDGYRELTVLWHLFQRARKPVFEQLHHAIDLRDIATLYEFWVLFELRTKIQAITGIEGTTTDEFDAYDTPGWNQRTTYAGFGTLHYNRTYRGYSGINLRPDYTWELPNGALIALDAKFRMTNLFQQQENDPLMAKVKDDDLQKMHTYRDAIPNVKAAIALYPGTTSHFRTSGGTHRIVDLEDVVIGNIDGIGAIPMKPVSG